MTLPNVSRNPRLASDAGPVSLDDVQDIPVPPSRYTPAEIEKMLEEAIALHIRGKNQEAMQRYREILLYDRLNKKALYYSAIALSQQNHPEGKVLALMEHAVQQLGEIPEAHYNLGILLHRMGEVERARDFFLKSLASCPDMLEAKTSLAGCYMNLGNMTEGRRWMESAAATRSKNPDAIYARSFARLALGDYAGGWSDYTSRWSTASFLAENRRNFGGARHWNGGAIPGKVLYVHTEQGAGDVLMVSRFLGKVAQRSQAKAIILEVGDSLVDYLAQVEGVDYVIPSNSPIPDEVERIDRYLPMMTVPQKAGMFGLKQVTHADGWLRPIVGHHVALPEKQRLRVGIAWAGSKAHKNDRYRSILWPQWRDVLLNDPRLAGRVDWVSVQVGDRARDLDDGNPGVFDATTLISGYAETASVLSQLDGLIAVDTATVHACASLIDGPWTWMLTPAAPDWRWGLEGERTPWYTRVRMIRQSRADDWETPLLEAADRVVRVLEGASWAEA